MKDVLYFAGRRLPDEDKIKLIDLVPGIGNYVTKLIINTKHDGDGKDVCALVKLLPNLRNVVTKSPIWFGDFEFNDMNTKTPTGAEKCRRHRQVLVKLAEVNPRITAFEGFCTEAILDYIRCVKEHDPQYEAADVRKVFYGGYDDLEHFLQNFPDMKLKMNVQIRSPESEDKLVQNGRRHLIHDLELEGWYTLRSEFKSVRNLIVQLASNFSSNLRFLPAVENVQIWGPVGAGDPSMIRSLLEVKNLRKLHLVNCLDKWTEANYNAFRSILMKPSLKHLEFHKKPNSGRMLINAFLDCERNDFESLTVRYVRVEDKKIMIYKSIDFSLVKLFTKFKRIKEIIIIKADNEEFIERIRGEINLIVGTLPRNRSLCVQIGGDVFRY